MRPPRQGLERFATHRELYRRWPDPSVAEASRGVAEVFRRLLLDRFEASGSAGHHRAFGLVCGWIAASWDPGSRAAPGGRYRDERRRIARLIRGFDGQSDRLQSLASLLAILMHFAVDEGGPEILVNQRRPGKAFPTFPTSPALARLVGEAVVSALVREPFPARCASARDARRFARRAFAGRIFDPSMESGQLLLAIAETAVGRIRDRCADPAGARRLQRAVLERLCDQALWGIDRTALAAPAMRLLFSLLGRDCGLGDLAPRHLLGVDALERYQKGGLGEVEAIVNNPPWGVAMDDKQREALRRDFETINHRVDLYVPFSEMAVRSLRPGGLYVLVLPSQVLAARNAAKLRVLLAEQSVLERIVLLPRAAFAEATVRGAVLIGKRGEPRGDEICRCNLFSLVKSLRVIHPVDSTDIPVAELARRGLRSWWPLLGTHRTGPAAGTVRLEQLARVALGIQVHHLGRGDPPQTAADVRRRKYLLTESSNGAAPAVHGRNVRPFRLRRAAYYVKLGRQLSWVGDHEELRRRERVLVREICRRDGRLTAAVATNGVVPLHGVLTLVPKRIDIWVLVALLNSSSAAECVSRRSASFSKVDFQKITVGEMRDLPMPVGALTAAHRKALGLPRPTARESALRRKLLTASKALGAGSGSAPPPGLLEQLDALAAAMYSGRAV